jgi:LPS export ABC transporter protein LptC
MIAGAIGLSLLGGCRKEPSVPAPSGAGGEPPSQVLRGFEMQDLQDGAVTMKLKAQESRLMDQAHVTELTQPVVTFYKSGQISSVLRAPQGRIQMDSHVILAWGGVTVVSSDSSTLTTEKLRYDPQQRELFSDDAVHLEKPDSVTDGRGLEATPDLARVKIGHEKVRVKKAA